MKNKEESRSSPRLPFIEGILINDNNKGHSHDISEGGMFICTEHPHEVDSLIDITIPIQLKVKAKVRHQQPEIGVGVEFIDLNDSQKLLIRHLIESLHLKSQEVKSQGKQILLIEDNAMTRKFYKAQLIADGYYVLEASDGVEGISILRENTPDLIVLDLYMKRMDGLKMLSEFESHSYIRNTKSILPLPGLGEKYQGL